LERIARRVDAARAIEYLNWCVENPGKPRGLATNYQALDYLTGGLIRGELTLVAARPSVGKTAFAMSLANRVLDALNPDTNDVLLIVSQEMSEEQLLWRWAAVRSGVGTKAIERGEYLQQGIPVRTSREEKRAFYRALRFLEATPNLYLIAQPITTAELGRELEALRAEGKNIVLVIDDYLALHTDQNDNEVQRINGIARTLKNFANIYDAPFFVVAQLNRSVERREGNKIPMLSDLRDGGEADADNVWFVHRDDYYEPGAEQRASVKALIYVAKARSSEVGAVPFQFVKYLARFDDYIEKGKQANAA
jgi:replicative DNA helicase